MRAGERINVMVSPQLRVVLRAEAEARGSTVSQIVRDVLHLYFAGPLRVVRQREAAEAEGKDKSA